MEVTVTRNIIPCLLIAAALVACSRSESRDAATDDSRGVGVSAEGVKPSDRVTVGDGTVRVKAGNTDVVVNKDGVKAGGVTVEKDGVKAGGATVEKDGVKTGGVTVDKDGVKTGGTTVGKDGVKAGGVTIKKDGTISVPGVP